MVVGSTPVVVSYMSDFVPVLSEDVAYIQVTIDGGFTLKRVCDMTKTYSQYPP